MHIFLDEFKLAYDMQKRSNSSLAFPHEDWRERLRPQIDHSGISEQLKSISQDIISGKLPTLDQGLYLLNDANLSELGQVAHWMKQSMYDNNVFFNSNVHINQTNICVLACKFCAFRRGPKSKDAYEFTVQEYIEDLEQYANHVDEVHTVGGLHPNWTILHYEELFSSVRSRFPHISIKSLSAVEIKHISTLSGLSFKKTLERLKNAGLTSLPGGGAEILNDDVRSIICKGKESSEEYLEIHRTAHQLGIPSNCTMLFGTIETPTQRIEHLLQLQNLQSQTNGFQCFVPYPFLQDNSRLPEAQLATGQEILRMIAVSRIMLPNIPHIKSYRMNIGDHLAELALQYGADDIDGTVQKESIMHLAGSDAGLDLDTQMLARLIQNAGGLAVRRNTTYTKATIFEAKPRAKTIALPMARG